MTLVDHMTIGLSDTEQASGSVSGRAARHCTTVGCAVSACAQPRLLEARTNRLHHPCLARGQQQALGQPPALTCCWKKSCDAMKATAAHATPWATRPAAPAPPSMLEKHTAGWGRREGLRLGAAAASSLCRCCRPRWPTQHCLHVALVTALMLPGCAAGRGVRGQA